MTLPRISQLSTLDGSAEPDVWSLLTTLASWLEAANSHRTGDERLDELIYAVVEEVGEVAQSVKGVRGSNPRKGVTHTWDDVKMELCDTTASSFLALAKLCGGVEPAHQFLAAHLARVVARANGQTR